MSVKGPFILLGDSSSVDGNNTVTDPFDSTSKTNNLIAIGYQAGYSNMTSAADGTIAIGYQALFSLTEGQYNTAIGYESMIYQTDGDKNTTLGYKAFRTSDNGESDNVVIGYQSGLSQNHASTDRNVFISCLIV